MSDNRYKKNTIQLLLAGIFAALTAVGAFIRIPFAFVPLTMQTFFVMLAGNLLQVRFALLSQVAYLLIGLSGIPIFAHGGGPGYILQPTFGYLLAFPLAAFFIARMSQSLFSMRLLLSPTKLFIRIAVINLIAILMTFFLGVFYLFLNVNLIAGAELTPSQALITGMLIFLPGDIIKALVAAFFAVKIRNRLLLTHF